MTAESAAQRASSRKVMDAVCGATVAEELIREIRAGRAKPDALLSAIRAAGSDERLRGLASSLQRTIAAERGI